MITSSENKQSIKSWWEREDLFYGPDKRLQFAGKDLTDMARQQGTPLYVYSGERIMANVDRLRQALSTTNCRTRLLYALKANRHPAIIRLLNTIGVGLDVCSPGEVRHALAEGLTLDQLSFTAGCLDRKDYLELAHWRDLWVNVDSLTAIRRLGELCPGREIGLRVNPSVGLGYGDNPMVRYAAARPTKFGLYAEAIPAALEMAERYQLRVTGLHCHAGSGFLTPQFSALDEVLGTLVRFVDQVPGIQQLNLGGGLGIPLTPSDQPLDLVAWSGLIKKHFGGKDLTLLWEPGDYLVKDAGVLLTEVTQVENKGGVLFVGLNAGFNIHPEPAFYKLPLEPVPTELRPGQPETVTLAGNINEAHDLWASGINLPPVKENDFLALLNAGAYGASMASHHCLRNQLTEIYMEPFDLESTDAANRKAWEELYASTPELVWGQEPLAFLEEFRESLISTFQEPVRLLDAGTGEGRNLPFLLSLGSFEITALDASLAALHKIPANLKTAVLLREGLLTATNLPEKNFDGILLMDVAETLPNLEAALREMRRILKPGGVLLCNFAAEEDGVAGIEMDPAGSPEGYLYQNRYFFRFFSAAKATEILEKTGFTILIAKDCSWEENPHPGFRKERHQHTSHVLLAQRPIST